MITERKIFRKKKQRTNRGNKQNDLQNVFQIKIEKN